jgi:cyclopropane-fatty-acyl-phospholipid synthase
LTDLTGITLSPCQFDELKCRLPSEVELQLISYQHFQPDYPFDAAVSIGMFEHLASPQQVRRREYMDIYRDYFRRVWTWTRPGARFGLQSVITQRIPRDRTALQDIGWVTKQIFPGASSPRLEDIVASATPYWEVKEIHTRREHYEKTAAEWLRRLTSHEDQICRKWGKVTFDDYARYLQTCVMAFHDGYQSLAQIILKRTDKI